MLKKAVQQDRSERDEIGWGWGQGWAKIRLPLSQP